MKNKSGIIGIIITTVILIVVVIVSNISTGNLTFVRDTIGKMFIPMQNGLIYIKEKITGNDQQLSDMESLKEENTKLKEQNTKLQEQVRELEILKSENNTLKEYVMPDQVS